MKPKLKNIIIKAIENGFDLNQFQTKDNPVTLEEIKEKLSSKYICTTEGDTISLGTIYDDLLAVWIDDDTLRIKPNDVDGVFESIVDIFRFLYNRNNISTSDKDRDNSLDYSKYLKKIKGLI